MTPEPNRPDEREAALADLDVVWHSVSDDKETNAAYQRLRRVLARRDAPREGASVDVDALAQHIRTVDGTNTMGAAMLAETIVDWLADRAPREGGEAVAALPAKWREELIAVVETTPRHWFEPHGMFPSSVGNWIQRDEVLARLSAALAAALSPMEAKKGAAP